MIFEMKLHHMADIIKGAYIVIMFCVCTERPALSVVLQNYFLRSKIIEMY